MAKAKRVADIGSLARSHTTTCIKVLAGIVMQETASTASRIAAAQALLDRGYGKAAQSVEHSGKVDTGLAPVDALALLLSQVDGIAGRQVEKQDKPTIQ